MNRRMFRTEIFLIVTFAFVGSQATSAQVQIVSRAQEITLTGRVQAQFNTTSVDGEPSSEFLMRRVRFTAEVDINDWLSGKIQPDVGEGKITLKDAYLRFSFSPSFRATVGQFKRPFDLFELTSSTQMLIIERAGGVRGVGACSGPGGVCSLSRLTEKLGYSDRDIGVMFDGRLSSGQVRYMVAITNGQGANADDINGTKSFSGRLAFTAADDVTISANVAAHDYVNPLNVDEYALAFGGDIEYGNFNEGVHIQAGMVAGDNWQNLSLTNEPSTFMAAQGIVTYKHPIEGNDRISAIEPLARVSWADPDTGVDADHGLLFTPGFVVYFSGRNKVAVNLDVWSPNTGGTETSLKLQSYLHF